MLYQPKITRKDFYRPDIDGLRAIAVAAVIIFHASPSLLPGGFLGVDIFFVISGFLITGIISRDIADGRFSLLAFYQRRVRRIYPALIIVLTASLGAGLLLMMPTQFQQLSRHTMGAALFIPNLLLWSEAGYFDVSSLRKPLLHLWSLGVEEQFYLVWPVLLLGVARSRTPPIIILVVIVAASLALNAYLAAHDATAAFYCPLSRAWELAVGGVLASAPAIIVSARIRSLLSGLGIALVVAAVMFSDETSSTPWNAVVAVIGVGLVISCGADNWLSRMTFATKPLVVTGLISYPLYLWHWPILVFGREVVGQSALSTVLLIVVAVLLAALTYLVVERPVHRMNAPKVAIPLFGFLAILGGFGAINTQADIRTLFYPEKMREILAFSNYDFRSDARIGTCWLYAQDQNYSDQCGFSGNSPLPKIAVWGDSHAGRLFPGLAQAAKGRAQVGGYAADSCPPILGDGRCEPFTARALSALLRMKPTVVILYAWWPHYSETYEPSAPIIASLNSTIDALERGGIKVAIIGPFPDFSEKLPDLILKKWLSDKSSGIPVSIPNMPTVDVLKAEAGIRALARQRHLAYLSLTDLLCRDHSCATTWSGDPVDLLTWDYGHLTTRAGEAVGDKVLDTLSIVTE